MGLSTLTGGLEDITTLWGLTQECAVATLEPRETRAQAHNARHVCRRTHTPDASALASQTLTSGHHRLCADSPFNLGSSKASTKAERGRLRSTRVKGPNYSVPHKWGRWCRAHSYCSAARRGTASPVHSPCLGSFPVATSAVCTLPGLTSVRPMCHKCISWFLREDLI